MEFIKKKLKIIIILFICILFISALTLKYYLNTHQKNIESNEDKIEVALKDKKQDTETNSKKEKIKKVYVDIKGAIKKPDVYEINNNQKVIDVVTMAGGLTEEADTTYVNLARKVSDEMVVVIYTKDQIKEAKKKETLSFTNEETCICPVIQNDACITDKTNDKEKSTSNSKSTSDAKTKSNTSTNNNSKVNINTASLTELQTLSGVGASKAQAIIDYREEKGKFEKIEDILNVSGIGDSVYEKIKDNITV